jgi:hypothetical protein
MNPSKIESFIDNKIEELLHRGESIEFVIEFLSEKIKSYSSRDTFIRVSPNYLIRNWELINYKKKYNTYYVIYSIKRYKDLKWLFNSKVTDQFDERKCFKLMIFKEKMINNRSKDLV